MAARYDHPAFGHAAVLPAYSREANGSYPPVAAGRGRALAGARGLGYDAYGENGMRAVSARACGRAGWLGAVIGVALAAGLTGAGASPAGAAVPASAPWAPTAPKAAAGSCGTATGPFTVQGTQVLARERPGVRLLRDYRAGPAVPRLAHVRPGGPGQDRGPPPSHWCANTVRLQLNQDNLVSPDGTGLDRAYLTAIETEVTAAEQRSPGGGPQRQHRVRGPRRSAAPRRGQRRPPRPSGRTWPPCTATTPR